MRKEIIISEANDLAVVIEDGRAVEFFLRSGDQLVGDIIWGQVEAVVPGIEAAFVNIGQDRNGFIHVADLPSAQTPRRPTALKKPSIKVKERILVQIAKAPTGTKGARLTGRLTIPGRFLVLVPHDNRVSISRRITDTKERDRLRRLTLNLKDPGHGLIVRTEAIGRSEEDLRQDIEELIDIWADILHQVQIVTPPCLLHRDSDLIHRVLRDAMTADVTKVVVDTASGYQKARETLKGWMPELARYVIQHRGPQSILERYRIREELEAAISPKVWLPSGGYLVIEHTEALTVIDVNSGRLTQSKSLADTVLRTNIEAAAEVARQLRLRDIGGIVVIDFISMDSEGDKKKVQAAFSEALRQDKSRPQVTGFSEHGLIEVSRRRQGQNLLEQLTTPCETCGGTGRIRTSPLLAGGDRARTEQEHTEPLEETAAIVHEITDAPYATEVALAEGEPSGEEEGEGEGEAGRRRRRRRRRRGRGGQEEGIGGMLTSTPPDGMTPEEEDEEGYLPPVMVPEQRREERPRRGDRRDRPAPAARAEAAPLFDEDGPLVEEVSFDWGAPAPQPRREDRPRREERDRDRGRGRDRDREERPRRDDRPAAQAPARASAPAPAAPAAGYEVSAPARRTRRVERRPDAAPAVASTPVEVAPRPAAPAPTPAPTPAPRPAAAAPAPAPVAKPTPKPEPKPAAKRVEAPKRKVEPLPVPETVEEAAVPGLFVLKKKAPKAAPTEAPQAAEVEAPKKAAAKKAPAKKAEPAAEKPAAKKATTKKAAATAADEVEAKPAAKKTATKAAAKKADVTETEAKPAAKKTATKATATKKAAATKDADEAEAKPAAKKPAAKKATTKTTATKAKAGA